MKARSFLLTLLVAYPFVARSQPLVTGDRITPTGDSVAVGSFPASMALSPDGKYVVVSTTGARQSLSVLRVKDGSVAHSVPITGKRADGSNGAPALYMGLAFAPPVSGDDMTLYVSRGPEDVVAVHTLSRDGKLSEVLRVIRNAPENPGPPHHIAGLALSANGNALYAVNNNSTRETNMKGSMSIHETGSGLRKAVIELPGFPLAIAAVTKGPAAHRKIFVTSEQNGVVTDVDPVNRKVRRNIPVGDHPMALLLDKSQSRLFVACAGSDTVSIIRPGDDKVVSTVLLRPPAVRGLAGATPTGLALDPSESRLYVTLGDLNAVAVVNVKSPIPHVLGYIPVGWYPTSVVVAPDGKSLLVANARGNLVRTPNDVAQGPKGAFGRYVNNLLEGTVSRVLTPDIKTLREMTVQVLKNNRVASVANRPNPVAGLPVKHVFYFIKENRTYDQILGDMKKGNGDPSLVMFGQDVTPNQHALADRFVLLDNYYCCADVSADGWNWSTSGMISEYTARNVPFNYGGHGRRYDSEGTINGVQVDLEGIPDVSAAPCGFIWDNCLRNNVSFRNYGFFVTDLERKTKDTTMKQYNAATRKALAKSTDEGFREFDMNYADSNAWVELNAPDTVRMKQYGPHESPSRYAEWKREWDGYVQRGDLPQFIMIRLPRDHTAGTDPGSASPRAMVADNDYALGKFVEDISKSPYWKSTAIFVVEDDAQNGFDHVDAHRSTCFVISPYVKRGTVDRRFYNTDSTLATMENILKMPPMNRFDATAPVFDFWTSKPLNIEPYKAVRPSGKILREVNKATAYRSKDSARMILDVADAVPDDLMNDVLWHAVMGTHTPKPPIRYSLLREADD